MKIGLRQVILANMLLDMSALGWAIYLTYVGAAASNVPDAGLVVVFTVPLMAVLVVDLVVLYAFGFKQRGLKFFLGYYGLSRAVAIYAIYRFLMGSSMVLQIAVVLVPLALAIRTLQVIYKHRAK